MSKLAALFSLCLISYIIIFIIEQNYFQIIYLNLDTWTKLFFPVYISFGLKREKIMNQSKNWLLQFHLFLNSRKITMLWKPVSNQCRFNTRQFLRVLLGILPRYLLYCDAVARQNEENGLLASIRLIRHLFAIIVRARAQPRKRSARACNSERCESERHRHKTRDFEGFQSFRRGRL